MIEIRTNIGKAKGADGVFREFDGLRGRKGDTGLGLTGIEAEYYSSTSDESPSGGTWSADIPSYKQGHFIWMRIHVLYDDQSDGYTAPRVYNPINDISEYEAVIQASESERVEAENERVANEDARIEAETDRNTAEEYRAAKWGAASATAVSVGPERDASVDVNQTDNSISFDFEIPRGAKGDTGADGISPSVEIEVISGGHRVIITDAAGRHSFDVLDGDAGLKSVDWSIIENKPEAFPPTVATTSELGGIVVGDDLLVTSEGRLSVDKATSVDGDNTRPITAAAVYTEIGNINALLSTI